MPSRVLANRYEIERQIGRGATASVFLARDRTSSEPVAIKLLRKELIDSKASRRFLREVEVTMALHHRLIVPVVDAGEASGDEWYFVLPYMPGGTLRHRLKAEAQLPIADAVAIARDVAEALSYAHAQGVIHRDVKPENILFSDGRAHLADFGIARALERATGDTSTSAGVVPGTAAYMSPEQASGRTDYDARVDQFALGCVLYEMIAGVQAFVGPSPEAVLAQRLLHAPRELEVYRPKVNERLSAIVMKSLAVAAADRFRTMDEMLEALDGLADATLDAPAGTRARPFWRRPAIAGATVAGLSVVAFVAVQWRRSPVSFDETLVAVAPFDVYDQRLALWREGFMDVISGGLDGAGRLRTVSPSVSVRKWTAPAQLASARKLAEATGARYIVYGRLLPSGADSIRASATVFDARSGSDLNTVDVRESIDRPDRLADSLTIRLVGELGEPLALHTREPALGAHSLGALKAFLQGEYYLRRTQWDSAAKSYGDALAVDSTFALANWRMKTALVWRTWGVDTVGDAYALRAGRLNHGLSKRVSLLVTIDSLWASVSADDDGQWTRLRRLAAALEEATRKYPDDPWIWYKVGEARFHLPIGLEYPLSENLRAFDRAIALDPDFALPYVLHTVELALILFGADSAQRYTKGYQLAAMPGVEDSATMLVERLLDAGRAHSSAVDQAIAQASADVLYRVAAYVDMWFDADETARRVARALVAPGRRSSGVIDREALHLRLARILASRGHLAEAAAELRAHARLDVPGDETLELLSDLASYDAVPAETVDAVFRQWMRTSPRGVVFALPWWAARGDTLQLARAAAGFRSAPGTNRRLEAYGRRAASAYGALARRDTAGALAGFAALTDSLCSDCYRDWLTRAQLHAHVGQDEAARRDLDRVMNFAWTLPVYTRAALELGRVAERMGEPALARRSYGIVSQAWATADPTLLPFTKEAADALRRLPR